MEKLAVAIYLSQVSIHYYIVSRKYFKKTGGSRYHVTCPTFANFLLCNKTLPIVSILEFVGTDISKEWSSYLRISVYGSGSQTFVIITWLLVRNVVSQITCRDLGSVGLGDGIDILISLFHVTIMQVIDRPFPKCWLTEFHRPVWFSLPHHSSPPVLFYWG